MPYKTYNEQVFEHIEFLRSKGFDINELKVDAGFIRCHPAGKSQGRGELSYKSESTPLGERRVGIGTWWRGIGGESGSFQTYGLPPTGDSVRLAPIVSKSNANNFNQDESSAKRAYGFWINSSPHGESDYLKRKGVGHYGIRFRSSEKYGNVAVVPMFDADGKLWSYQLLNSNGFKPYQENSCTKGLLHFLRKPKGDDVIGIAESYVTAATCLELANIPMACAFSSSNIKAVVLSLRKRYHKNRLIIFADNDRHLNSNVGLLKAQEAQKSCDGYVGLSVPDFGDSMPSKEASDWNDLARLYGRDVAMRQILASIGRS